MRVEGQRRDGAQPLRHKAHVVLDTRDKVTVGGHNLQRTTEPVRRGREGGEGKGAYSFVACLSHLTIDHVSLSRRSTVTTPIRHLKRLGAHYAFPIHYIKAACLS